MCAAEALIQGSSGIVTNAKSRPIIYDHTKNNFTIREGIIVAKNKKVFDVCRNRIEDTLGKTISDIHVQVVEEADRNKRLRRSGVTKIQPKVIHLNSEEKQPEGYAEEAHKRLMKLSTVI